VRSLARPDTFKTTGAVSEAKGDACHAASGPHLRDLLRGNHRYVFTLVHKYQKPEPMTLTGHHCGHGNRSLAGSLFAGCGG
jgi:hypothetical protein